MSTDPIISIRNVGKRFGNFTALEDISVDIMPGEFFALLGPSGCGKSTLLRMIAGFEQPSEGQLLLDGVDMTHLAPNKRPINMVFQSYAVFPHMSVAKNVAYGLKFAGHSRAEIEASVAEALGQVHLQDFAERMPDQLSGGQRQRVALARALVKKPRVLLLDEPLSALDAKLRHAMRLELVKLQISVGVSFIMVTHDQSEALAMADRIAVLESGRLKQLASPVELYQQPCDTFVADFIGSVNLFALTALEEKSDGIVVRCDELGEVQVGALATARNLGDPAALQLGVRPEKVKVLLQPPAGKQARLQGKLGDVAFQGEGSIVEIQLQEGRSITAFVHEAEASLLLEAEEGCDIWCDWGAEDMLLLPRHTA